MFVLKAFFRVISGKMKINAVIQKSRRSVSETTSLLQSDGFHEMS
jgi:hypothetical protein